MPLFRAGVTAELGHQQGKGSMRLSTDKILAGIGGILALLALFGVGAATTMLGIAVVLLAATFFI
jgi:hypothetical protein